MKILGKILFILLKVAGILATLLMLAVTIYFGWEHSELKKTTSPLVNYNGKLYEREELMDIHSKLVTGSAVITIVLLAVTLMLFIIGAVVKKKKKAAQIEAA